MPHAAEPGESGKQGEQQHRVRSYGCNHLMAYCRALGGVVKLTMFL